MSNSGKVWDIREAYKLRRNNSWEDKGNLGLSGGGNSAPSLLNVIDKINITVSSDSSDFGDLTVARDNMIKGGGQRVSGMFAGGTTPSSSTVIEKVIFVSGGGGTDYGDLTTAGYTGGKAANNHREVYRYTEGGRTTNISYYDYLGAASGGKTADFGDSTVTTEGQIQPLCDGVRGISGGGSTAPTTQINTLESFTLMSLGNAVDFGDLNNTLRNGAGVSSKTRGIVGGGLFFNSPSPGSSNQTYNVLDYVTIASAGNATDFGDLSQSRQCTAIDNTTRGVFLGGYIYPSAPSNTAINTMDIVEIATTGNATDFGDLSQNTRQNGSVSNGHGGLEVGLQLPSVTYMPGSGRAFIGGGDPGNSNIIQILHIPTLGNTSNFGDLTQGRYELGALGSHTRAVFGGGKYDSTIVNIIDSVEMQSQGNAADFGDLTQARHKGGALSSSTRGVWGGGQTPSNVNIIDYATIASVGNATDFGDLTAVNVGVTGLASPTRGVFIGGNDGSALNVIQYITIASTGNATDFGDTATSTVQNAGGSASETRGLSSGGYIAPGSVNNIQYITIASTGNATDFGDLTTSRSSLSATSNNIRSIAASGEETNVIDFVTIASTGNATDFGDIIANRNIMNGGTSDSHGGLQA
jgi:hypothetical protein